MRARFCLLSGFLLVIGLASFASAQTCTAGNTDPSVTICLPQAGSTLQSPIHIQLATNDSSQVDILQVWYNGVKRWENPVSSADIFLAAEGAGPYHITAVAHDKAGHWFQATVSVSINGQIYVCTQPQIANQQPHSVVICQPIDGEIHFSPVHLTWFAMPATGDTVTAQQIFVDGQSMFSTPPALGNGFQVNSTYLPMSVGRHRISVQGYDSTGPFKATIYMHVSRLYQGCAPPTTLPGINVCSLTDGQTVTGVITVKAAAAASVGIRKMTEVLDGNLFTTNFHGWLDNGITTTPGSHTLVITATTYSGAVIQRTLNLTVN